MDPTILMLMSAAWLVALAATLVQTDRRPRQHRCSRIAISVGDRERADRSAAQTVRGGLQK